MLNIENGINVLSLYGGIECGKVALDRAGIKVNKYFSSEIDKKAIAITKYNHPNIIHLGNVFDIDYTQLPKIDLVIGGFPCTMVSISKRGREIDLEGETGKLFNECVRAVELLKPKYFMFENNNSIHKDVKGGSHTKIRCRTYND